MGLINSEVIAAVEFAKGAKVPTGFGYLDEDGHVDPSKPVELWVTSRMTYVFALATLLGIPGTKEYLRHGVESLSKYFRDPVYGGWFSAIEATPDAQGDAVPVNDRKEAYAHAFVLLAANAAFSADDPEAGYLLTQALDSQEEHWFDPAYGKVRESWDRAFTVTEDYRGANANMHTVEAYLANADLTDNREALDRAIEMCHFITNQARNHDWRIPEHYDQQWNPLPDYNKDQPAHPFRPFGATPGHGLEWSRLILQARGSLQRAGQAAPEWMLESAKALYIRAVADAWHVDGAPGFIYTTDFAGQPVTRQRMHWVVCEALGAAIVLKKVLEEEEPDSALLNQVVTSITQWREYAEKYLIEAPGRWRHELDPHNQPASETWPGKPDVYHFFQMLILPDLPVSPSFAAALKENTARK